MKKYILSILLIFVIDLIFIRVVLKNKFEKLVENVQGSSLEINYKYALLSYLAIISLFSYFVIYKQSSYFETFLIGFLSYAIFDFTNLALFKNYDLQTGITDMFWGGSLFLIVKALLDSKIFV